MMEQRYDCAQIMTDVQTRFQAGETARHKVAEATKQLETTKLQHQMDKTKLKKYETAEKNRIAGLKKAQQARKKKGGKS